MSITKCKGFGCPLANYCERYEKDATPTLGEHWFRGVPFSDEGGLIECHHYIDKENLAVKLMERLQNGKDGSITA